MPDERKINCFLIGAQKAGSTTLYSWISKHPEIDAPEAIKDFHYFSTEKYMQKGYDWFEKLYKQSDSKIRINGAVNYLFRPEVPERIFQYNPDARFLVVLRDPVKRAFSAYQFFHKLDKEKRDFLKALEDEKNGLFEIEGDEDDFGYLGHGFYHRQLNNWFKYFDRDRFLILLYEELFKSPEIYLPRIFEFLDVSTDFFPKLTAKNNTGSVKYKWLNSLMYGDNSVRRFLLDYLGLKNLFPLSWRGSVLNNFRDWNTKKGAGSERIASDMYQQLAKSYDVEIKQLSTLLNQDLNQIWKY